MQLVYSSGGVCPRESESSRRFAWDIFPGGGALSSFMDEVHPREKILPKNIVSEGTPI